MTIINPVKPKAPLSKSLFGGSVASTMAAAKMMGANVEDVSEIPDSILKELYPEVHYGGLTFLISDFARASRRSALNLGREWRIQHEVTCEAINTTPDLNLEVVDSTLKAFLSQRATGIVDTLMSNSVSSDSLIFEILLRLDSETRLRNPGWEDIGAQLVMLVIALYPFVDGNAARLGLDEPMYGISENLYQKIFDTIPACMHPSLPEYAKATAA